MVGFVLEWLDSGFQSQKHRNIRPTALMTVLQRAGPPWGVWRPGETYFAGLLTIQTSILKMS